MKLVMTIVLAAVTPLSGCQFLGDSFDSNRWKTAGREFCENSTRKRMVGDLTESHLSLGMTMREVRRLLGKPYWIGGDTRGKKWGTWWTWMTGPSFLDCFTFDIRFVRGRAVEWEEGET